MTRNNAAQKIAEPETTGPGSEGPAHLAPWHFKAGQSGNPSGRPRGSRHKLNELTLKKLLADFELHGDDAITRVRTHQPAAYLAVIAGLLPKQQEKIESPLIDLTDEELAQLELWLAASRAKNVTINAEPIASPDAGTDATEPQKP